MIESLILMKIDKMTQRVADDMEKGEMAFDDECFTSCVTANFTDGRMKLLRVLAEELTDSLKDYHIVMTFIDRIAEMNEKQYQKIAEMTDEERREILTENEIELIEFLKDDMEE